MMQAVVLNKLSRSFALRFLLLLLGSWWLFSPVSAAVALLLNQWLIKTEAVIAASFFGPLLVLLWFIVALKPRAFHWFCCYLLTSLLLALPWWLAPFLSF